MNPYNSRSPDAPFVGRTANLHTLLTGIVNARSFLIVGGRRMGKTMLLRRLRAACCERGISCYEISLQEAPTHLTPAWLWGRIVHLVTDGGSRLGDAGNDPYAAVRATLKDWMTDRPVIVEIDEADIMMRASDCTTFFNNLRHFMGDSPWAGRILFVLTAVHGLAWFRTQGSPLNLVSELRLERLSLTDTRELAGVGCKLTDEMLVRLDEKCGGHPYLLQGTLEHLWQTTVADVGAIDRAADVHVESAPVFSNWWERFTPRAQAMYRHYARTDRMLSWRDVCARTSVAEGDAIDAQQTLAYHGVIELGENASAMWRGSLFKEWTAMREMTVLEGAEVGAVTVAIVKPTKRPALPGPDRAKQGHWWLRTGSGTVYVFVHGILSDSILCWHTNPHDATAAYWPWLVATDDRLGYPNIYLGGYHSGIDAGCFGIEEAADSLWARLTTTDSSGNAPVTSCKQVIFVAHSMGGLVVRQMLRRNPPEMAGKKVGVVLVASPSRGSRWSDAVGAALGSIITHRQRERLEYDNSYLRELNQAFRELLNGGANFEIVGADLFEHHFPAKFLRFFTVQRIVKSEDSDAFFSKKLVVAGTTHMSIAKPTDCEANVHLELVRFVTKRFSRSV